MPDTVEVKQQLGELVPGWVTVWHVLPWVSDAYLIYDSGNESNFQTFANCLFFITQQAVKS